MIIKKYQAETEKNAILQAKEELGKDAIIMNIKTTAPRGIYKLFRKTVVEVTAAIDDIPSYEKAKPVKENRFAGNPNILYDELEEKNVFRSNVSETALEQKLDSLQQMLEQQMREKRQEEKKAETEAEAEQENELGKNLACVQLIYNQLVDNEVEEQYANQIISEIESSIKKECDMDQLLSNIYQKIVLKLGQTKTLELHDDRTKFVYFIGPTGVGKTTTIAKLASNLKMTRKAKIALVTADTYRIAAVEQLRIYANILDVPLKVIYDEKEMAQIKDEYRGYDVVLIDTAGRSHKSREQRDDIERLIEAIPEDDREIYLVLSATTKYKDLVRITEAYSKITDYRLIFTKLDETSSIGTIYNIRMLTGAPLSYATFGQNVPDDISNINPQSIAKKLLGGND